MVAGYPGSTTLGEFRIVLPSPLTDEHWRYRSQYDAILNSTNQGIGLKVEGYDSNVGLATPVVSGVITKMDLPLDTPWVLSGVDTLFWLQQSIMYPGEVIDFPQGRTIVTHFITTEEVLWDDDFTNWSGGANYTQSGGTWGTGTDPIYGFPAVAPSASGATITSTSTWGNEFAGLSTCTACGVRVHGVIHAGTDSVDAGTVSILLGSDSTGANALRFSARWSYPGSNTWNVSGLIDVVSGGVVTNLVTTSVLTGITSGPTSGLLIMPFELLAEVSLASGIGSPPPRLLRLIINGNDANCQVTRAALPTFPGRIGVDGTTIGLPSGAIYINRLSFHSRTNQNGTGGTTWGTDRFQQGSFGLAGSYMNAITGQGQSYLDMINLAAAFDGYNIRKNPGAGYKSDTIDYGANLGTDRSTQIVFEEGVNVMAQGTTFQNVAEVFSTDAQVNSMSGDASSGGNVTWGRLGVAGDMVLTDLSTTVGMSGYTMLVSFGKLIAARKANPLTAIQIVVIRSADLLAANNGWGPREWDFVTVHMPSYNVERQKVQIVGYGFREVDGFVTYYVTQFAERSMVRAPLDGLHHGIDFVVNTYKSK